MVNTWIEHTKLNAKEKGISYKDALKDNKSRINYHNERIKEEKGLNPLSHFSSYEYKQSSKKLPKKLEKMKEKLDVEYIKHIRKTSRK